MSNYEQHCGDETGRAPAVIYNRLKRSAETLEDTVLGGKDGKRNRNLLQYQTTAIKTSLLSPCTTTGSFPQHCSQLIWLPVIETHFIKSTCQARNGSRDPTLFNFHIFYISLVTREVAMLLLGSCYAVGRWLPEGCYVVDKWLPGYFEKKNPTINPKGVEFLHFVCKLQLQDAKRS